MPTSTRSASAEALQAVGAVAREATLEPIALDCAHLRPYILVFEDLLPVDACQQLIGEFADSDEWKPALVGDRIVAPEIRRVDVIDLSHRGVLERNPAVRRRLEQTLYTAALKAVRLYQSLFPACRIAEGQAFELLRYRTGGYYREHTDSFRRVPRSLSCSFALNDDFSGGGWSFFGGEHTLQPPRGSVVLFPSNFMFPHEIPEVTRGTRYAIVTWMI
jgi:predicted 2-oxoglutarate/Fe(II)-dependent dioxygenase YbiX